MTALPVILVQGLAFGSIYALGALGFGLIYTTTRAFHIAFGAIGVVGSYVVVSLAPAGSLVGLAGAVVLGIAAAFVLTVLAFALYRTVEHRRDGRLAVFVVSLGLAFAIEASVVLTLGPEPRAFHRPELVAQHDVVGLPVSVLSVAAVALGLGGLGVVQLLLTRTRWGFQVRGLASNPELAALVGTHTRRVLAGVLLLASALVTLAAGLLGMYTSVTPATGTNLTLVAAVAVIAGGVGSYVGAYLFALGVGLLQATMAFVLPGAWTTIGVYLAILLVILLRPTGLGRGLTVKAV